MEDNHYEPNIGEVFNYHSLYGLVVTKAVEGYCWDCDFYKSGYCDFGLKCLPKERSDGKHIAFKKIRIMETKEIIIDGVTYICTLKEKVNRVEHEFVDLGLPSGRLWATCNIGAKKPTDYGDYFALGAVEPYNLDNCNTNNYENTEAAKLTEIDDAHDAAKVLWGDEWRMPTLTDFAELIDFCDYHYEDIDGISCGVFSSKVNDNKLIIPSAGHVSGGSLNGRGSYGYYWSRAFHSSSYAWRLDFDSSGRNVYTNSRYNGFSVRPVKFNQKQMG